MSTEVFVRFMDRSDRSERNRKPLSELNRNRYGSFRELDVYISALTPPALVMGGNAPP